MTRRRSISWLAVLALCLAQVEALGAQRSNDSCLGAIRNAPIGRNATADCLSFLAQTAPTRTHSKRTTATTVTSTKRVGTVTAKTGPTSSNASKTEHNGSHKRTEVDYDAINGERSGFFLVQALQERRVTTSSTSATLPRYAKKCVSEADYSSACSCFQNTRAAARPVTTETVTAIRTIANVAQPHFFANSTILARQNGTGTTTVASTIYKGRKSASGSSLRPTTLFTSRVTSSKKASSDSELRSISTSLTFLSTKPTVHVVTIATVTPTKQPSWISTTSTLGHPTEGTTAAHYTNSRAALATTSTNVTSSSWLNATTSVRDPIPINGTASWYDGTATSSLLASTSTGVVKTAENVKFPIYKNTTASWYDGTSTSFLPLGAGTGVVSTTGPVASPTTITSARLPFLVNTTAFWSNGTATTVPATAQGTGTGIGILVTGTGYFNTSTPLPTSTSTTKSSAYPTATEDLTCGETSTPFLLRVSQPGGTFDKWFVHVVGNGLLFTNSQGLASSFSVEGSEHLCAVGHDDGSGRPMIAAVGVAGAGTSSKDGTGSGDEDGGKGVGGEGPVWMLRQGTLKAYWEDYKALECTRDGGLSCALANSTSEVGSGWVGCGLQLSLGRDIDVGYGGLNCTAVSLEVVES